MTPLQIMKQEVRDGVTVSELQKEANNARRRLLVFEDLLVDAAELRIAKRRFFQSIDKLEKMYTHDTTRLDEYVEAVADYIDYSFDITDEDSFVSLNKAQKAVSAWVESFEKNLELLIAEEDKVRREEENEDE